MVRSIARRFLFLIQISVKYIEITTFYIKLGDSLSIMSVNKAANRFKCVNIIDNLNIEYSPSNLLFMWNKYQIFVYEGSLESPAKAYTPEYRVYRLLVTEYSFLCLDTNGFVHVTDRYTNVDQQVLSHQPRALGIKACVIYNQDDCLSLKYDSDTYYLCVNKINSDYEERKQIELTAKGNWPLQDGAQDKYILVHKKIDELCSGVLQKMFHTDSLPINSHFIAISFDKQTVYGCLFDLNGNEKTIDLVKIYACPSEICSIEIVGTENSYMLIGLKMGTVIRLALIDLYNSSGSFPTGITTEVIHLNAGLHKFIVTNDTFVYTDGTTMWRADNIYSKDITFKQFFVKNVKDFIQLGNNIICTTYSKMIYQFLLDAETSYLNSVIKEYNSADDVLKNCEYLKKIFIEVDKSKALAKRQSIEGTYIAAMSLSKRHEIMDKAISVSVTVCGSLEEVLHEDGEELTLPEDLSKYIEPYVYLFLIKVKIKKRAPGGLHRIISDIIANSDTEIHITLSNDTKILKTVTVRISKFYFLIPHHLDNDTEININIRIVTRLPGMYNRKQEIWTELYRKDMKMTAEHFIQAAFHKSLFCMKGWVEDFDKAIIEATNMDRHEFSFDKADVPCVAHEMYLRLPHTFEMSDFTKYFSKMKSQFMVDMLGMDAFLTSKNEIGFVVGRHSVEMQYENDGFTTSRLKIVSGSLKVTASIRNFFANIIYADNDCTPGEQFISLSFYTTVENLQKAVKECIANSASFQEFEPLMEKFESDIVGLLPV